MNEHMGVAEIKEWILWRNSNVSVAVSPMPFALLKGWKFNQKTGNLAHESGRFFSIVGLDVYTNTGTVSRWTQPIIDQPEVGLLGILSKRIGGVPHYLLQAKIEPGNLNGVQLSPTVQATRSNYMQVHGGKKTRYLEYFQDVKRGHVILDQLQSEQGARFLRKRNRNMIVDVAEDVELTDDFRWMTLAQIKELMRCDNTVNMDTRTVFSGLRSPEGASDCGEECSLMTMTEILFRISELKSRYELITEKIGLNSVEDWQVTADEIVRPDRRYFRVVGVNVSIENREVNSWCQPMVEPMQEGLCVLFKKLINGTPHYLLQAKVECGNFDVVELAPTIQCLTGPYKTPIGYVPRFLPEFINCSIKGRIVLDVLQSEEGGRFYHEQNRNVVYEVEEGVDLEEEDNYLWLTMRQMKELLRFNNILNIQVRSLISML